MVTPSSTNPDSPRRILFGWKSWLLGLTALGVGVFGVWNWYEPTPPAQLPAPKLVGKVSKRVPPTPSNALLHRVEVEQDNGNLVFHIVGVKDGEEFIVDANSGKLLEI